ncbi:MAG: GNAT family N-acetyltransferase [Patescibacteria group bacterium]
MELTKKDLVDINNLLSQLSENANPLNFDQLAEIIKQKNFYIIAVAVRVPATQQIIGMGSIIFVQTLMGLKALIEDIIVDKEHRGQKLGERIVGALIEFARTKNVKYIELTSKPARKVANKLYEKFGFQKRKTNVYRLEVNPRP